MSLQRWFPNCCLTGKHQKVTRAAFLRLRGLEEPRKCLTVGERGSAGKWEPKASRVVRVERRLAEASRHLSTDALMMARLVMVAGVWNALFGT